MAIALKPYLFVGSSSEAKPFAEELCTRLHDKAFAIGWWDSPDFRNGTSTLEALLKAADRYDFAVLLFTADDECTVRSANHRVPRDNVLFEYGLFLGLLPPGRTLAFVANDGVKLPSDVLGITMERFTLSTVKTEEVAEAGRLAAVVGHAIENAEAWWKLNLGDVISSWSIDAADFRVTLLSAPLKARPARFKDRDLVLVVRQKNEYVGPDDDTRIAVGPLRRLGPLEGPYIRMLVSSEDIIGSAPDGTVIEARVFVVSEKFASPKTIREIISSGGRLIGGVRKTVRRSNA